MMDKYPFDPDFGVHPGETLRDELAARGIEPDAEMQAVLDGGVLSNELAARLEKELGISAQTWKNLMRQYYEWALKRIDELFDEDESEEFEQLVTLAEAYEEEHYPIGKATLQDIVEFWEDQRPEQAAVLRTVVDRVVGICTDEDAADWLYSAQKLLGGESAVDLILDGRVGEVLELLDRMEAGA